MSELRVKLSGLLTVIRHIDPPPMDRGSDSTSEPITIAFVHDDGGAGHMAGHTGGMHNVTMHIPASALPKTGAESLTHLMEVEPPTGDMVSFSLEKWRLHLPMVASQEPVSHDRDEPLTTEEPAGGDYTSLRVGERGTWAPLTRLPTLNHLTGTPLNVNPHAPDNRLDGVVLLSGGRLECVRSPKSLRDGFFEFFTEDATKLVHPAVEDIIYTRQFAEGETFTLGISRISQPDKVFAFPLALEPGQEIWIRSLPAKDAAHATNLNHFQNYYKLMYPPQTTPVVGPFVRMLGRCTEEGALVHTMPGIHSISPEARKNPGPFTVDTCSCFASQAYGGPLPS